MPIRRRSRVRSSRAPCTAVVAFFIHAAIDVDRDRETLAELDRSDLAAAAASLAAFRGTCAGSLAEIARGIIYRRSNDRFVPKEK